MIDSVKKGQIRDFLVSLAKKKATTGYVKLNEKLKLGIDFSNESQMELLYTALDEISAESFQKDKVFLGSIVVNKMRNRPGPRFYKGAEKIIGSPLKDQDDFFEVEREKLYLHYASK